MLLAMVSHADARHHGKPGKSGIEAANAMRQPQAASEDASRIYDEPQDSEGAADASALPSAQAVPGGAALPKEKPNGSSIGLLIVSIETVLAKRQSNTRSDPLSNKTASLEPERAELRSDDTPSEPARNETSFAKTRPGYVQNVSVHYKTQRVAQIEPLDAVSLGVTPVEGKIASQSGLVKGKADGALQAQPVSAVDEDEPHKFNVSLGDPNAGPLLPDAAPLRRSDVAVYDISRGMVYLPNGEALEAHSGIGPMRDNPAYVNRRNVGPTPPHVYDLTLRESRFHGVEAIRLTPVDGDGAVFGRVGLLAHTYMLRRPGDSNGCVVFKQYHRFLAAFKKGQITQMVVVPRLREAPASIFAASYSGRTAEFNASSKGVSRY